VAYIDRLIVSLATIHIPVPSSLVLCLLDVTLRAYQGYVWLQCYLGETRVTLSLFAIESIACHKLFDENREAT